MTACSVKGYSLLLRSRLPSLSPLVLFSLFDVGGKENASENLGHGLRVYRSVEDRERRPMEERVRSDDKARAARERRGVNHDFGGILARDGMRFYPRRSSLRSFVHSLQR